MKKVIVIVVFLFVMKPILPVLEYALNYDYIVKELCENKAKPEMKCDGKCHLMKELAKASDSNTPVSSDKKTSHQESEVLFMLNGVSYTFSTPNYIVSKDVNSRYANNYNYNSPTSVFHPPSVLI